MTKVLHIKNMVCPRCIETVDRIFRENRFDVESVKLGEIEVSPEPDSAQLEELAEKLHRSGFELLTDPKSRIAGRIKSEIPKSCNSF